MDDDDDDDDGEGRDDDNDDEDGDGDDDDDHDDDDDDDDVVFTLATLDSWRGLRVQHTLRLELDGSIHIGTVTTDAQAKIAWNDGDVWLKK